MALNVEGRATPPPPQGGTAFDSGGGREGLLSVNGLGPEAALVIAPCSAVHTFGMKFAIDVIYAGRDGTVRRVTDSLRPSRLSASLGSFAAIEMAAGSAARAGLRKGDRLV